MKESTETARKSAKELDENGWNQKRCIINFILIQTDPKAAPIISESAINTTKGKANT